MGECVRNEGMHIYFVCDFNGRWLKDLNLLYCVSILLPRLQSWKRSKFFFLHQMFGHKMGLEHGDRCINVWPSTICVNKSWNW
jgi:hypothetical protein